MADAPSYSDVISSTPGLAPSQAPQSVVDQVLSYATPDYLRAQAAKMASVFQDLSTYKGQLPSGPLSDQYDSLMSTGSGIMSSVNAVTGVFDAVASGWDYWSNLVQSGTSEVLDWFGFGDSSVPPQSPGMGATGRRGFGSIRGLGFLPLLAGSAVVIAGVAAITYWLSQAYQLQAKLSSTQQLIAAGVPPDQAAQITSNLASSGSVTGNISSIVKWAVIGGALYAAVVYGPKLLKSFKRGHA